MRIYQLGILIVFGLLLFGCTATPPVLPPGPLQCADKNCFINAASQCSAAKLVLNESYGAVKYSTNGCVFTKRIVSLNESESPDLKLLVEGKSMACKYEKGKFDTNLVDSLLLGIEPCEGELKDAINELLVFA
ncbi:MAG TPA: hypothetical protein VGQ00_04560 [Candidatus Norongarragalinales archaeon]|jgi:hypothetical protein|nr:hypothetical protein [Candidatus Norongarragalinales archaeon]